MMRICKICNVIKPIEEFKTHKGCVYNRSHHCLSCHREKARKWCRDNTERNTQRAKKWALEHPEQRKQTHFKAHLRRKYHLSIENYNELLLKQDHKCAICQEKVHLVVDHCHKTNQIRGLLCNKCNQALGFFKDNSYNCQKAFDYLEKFKYNSSRRKDEEL